MTHPTLTDLQDEGTWLERRSLIPTPLHSTGMVTTEDSRREFLEGARLLRVDQLRNYAGEQIGPTPIQLAVADTIATGHRTTAILEPRRTTKTTAVQCVMVGRCALRPDYLAGWTLATTGAKAGERFAKDIAAPLMRLYPSKHVREGFVKVLMSKGAEGLVFRNGSYLNVYAPGGDGFRSNAFDVAWVDEAGEAEIELGEDLTAAIRPTFHTRADAQLILSGTAGKFRKGQLLWDGLVDPAAAVLRHGVPDDVDPEALEAWEPDEDHPRARVRELVELSHPGIGYTTPLDAIEGDWNTPAMRRNFPAEILSVFGSEGANMPLLSQPKWLEAARDPGKEMTTPPKVFALVAQVHPDGDWSSIGVAWWGVRKEKVRVGLLHYQEGRVGFAKKLLMLSRKFKRPIYYDPFSAATTAEIVSLREARPAPAEKPLIMRDVQRAAVNFSNRLNAGEIEHFSQPELSKAVEIAVKRNIGDAGGWGYGRPKNVPDADISPLETVALAAYLLPQERGATADLEMTWL